MLMYLSYTDFNINKGRFQIENRDRMVIVIFVSNNCQACNNTRKILADLPDAFPEITFGVLNIDKHPQMFSVLKTAGITLDKVPTYMFFKLGVFDRILNTNILSKESIRKSLYFELDSQDVMPKNQQIYPYLKVRDF